MERGYRESKTVIRLHVPYWDLTNAKAELVFSRSYDKPPDIVKSTENGGITFKGYSQVDGRMVSIFECMLTDEETANWKNEELFTFRVNDDDTGWQVVANGSINVILTVQRGSADG